MVLLLFICAQALEPTFSINENKKGSLAHRTQTSKAMLTTQLNNKIGHTTEFINLSLIPKIIFNDFRPI